MNVLSFSIAEIVERFLQRAEINVFFLGAACVPDTPTTGTLVVDCCARAVSGHAPADPAIPTMKSRRRIAPQGSGPRRLKNSLDYSRDLRPTKWGSGTSLHGSNPELLMSALGRKQTCAVQKAMSALPPTATAKADSRKGACLLYPQKPTCALQRLKSALGETAR